MLLFFVYEYNQFNSCKHFGLFMEIITWYQFFMPFLGQLTLCAHLCMACRHFHVCALSICVYGIYICSCGHMHICGVYV